LRQGQTTPVDLLALNVWVKSTATKQMYTLGVLIDRDGARELADKEDGPSSTPAIAAVPCTGSRLASRTFSTCSIGRRRGLETLGWQHRSGRRHRGQEASRGRRGTDRKTVTTQYASFDPSPTRNPWNLQRTPGGSSSGSAAPVACGMCLGALSSQTGGSTTRPAAYCGVPSLKPTFGRSAPAVSFPWHHRWTTSGPWPAASGIWQFYWKRSPEKTGATTRR